MKLKQLICTFVVVGVVLSAQLSVAQIRSVIFEHGINGYDGVKDTYISRDNPDVNYSQEDVVWLDSQSSSAHGTFNVGFFKFEDIMGNGSHQIPQGVKILSAKIDFYTPNSGASWQNIMIANFAKAIDLDTATYASVFGDAAPEPGVDFSNEHIGVFSNNSIGFRQCVDITSVVQELADGAPNNGFIFYPHYASDGIFISTVEKGNASPKLVVEAVDGTIYTFQEGVNGYNDVHDAFISYIPDFEMNTNYGGAPGDLMSVNFGLNPTFLMDANDNGENEFGLLRFDNIFGNAAGQIPVGTDIADARVEIIIPNTGDLIVVLEIKDFQNNNVNTHFDERTVTLNNFINDGVFVADGQEIGDYVTEFDDAGSFDVTTSLQKWSQDPSLNLGWYLEITGGNGVEIFASESAASTGPARLSVTFEDNSSISGFTNY